METTPRYRSVALGPKQIVVEPRDNGITYVRSPIPLSDYPERITDKLLYWAEKAPERTYIAHREPGHGLWLRISYAEALQAACRLGQAMLDRGLTVDLPWIISSC